MTAVTPDLERPQPAAGESFSDAVTAAFGDPAADVYGLVRIGLSPGPRASVLGLLFDGREIAAGHTEGLVELAEPSFAPAEVAAAGVETVEPLARWRARFEGGGGGFDVELSALSPPLVFGGGDDAVGKAARSEGYEQLCRVRGTVSTGGAERTVDCLGQRGHVWGAPDWDRIALTRSVSGWLGEDAGFVLSAVRGHKASGHGDEAVSVQLVERVDDGLAARPVADGRLSTTYDGDGRHRKAGLELWESEDAEYARRVTGTVVCGTSLELGRLRLDCAFYRWHMEGREGIGRYDVLRRA